MSCIQDSRWLITFACYFVVKNYNTCSTHKMGPSRASLSKLFFHRNLKSIFLSKHSARNRTQNWKFPGAPKWHENRRREIFSKTCLDRYRITTRQKVNKKVKWEKLIKQIDLHKLIEEKTPRGGHFLLSKYTNYSH